MRELTMDEVQDVNGGGLWGAVVVALGTPVGPAVAAVVIGASLAIAAISLLSRE
ncbi:MAG: hypothetical protein ACK51V_02760 [bacterium]|jgi:hypothetical protein